MGINLKERGKLDSALIMFEMSKEKFKSLKEEKVGIYTNIGVIQMDKLMYKEAEANLLFGLQLAKDYEDKANQAGAYGNLGLLYCKLKQYNKAIEYGEKGYDLAMEIEALQEIKDNSFFLYQTYKETGNKEKALFYYEKHISIKDSIINEDKSKIY
ncbi:MAG: tetratricopeptide repeat protein [Bacteroidetes bacterium]|nr:tetratricopeptide repeat protein [Bacteroidota bacterium]